MSISPFELPNLPIEILEKIFVNLNIDKVKKLNKFWNRYVDSYKYMFTELNIDLLKVTVKNLKGFDPVKVNITCSQIYDEIPIIKYNFLLRRQKLTDELLDERRKLLKIKMDSRDKETKFIKEMKIKLNLIRKFPSLKTMNINLDLIYLAEDGLQTMRSINSSRGSKATNIAEIDTFSVFCVRNLLNTKAKNIYLNFNNYHNIYTIYDAIRYEYSFVRFLIKQAHKFDTFIYEGAYDMFFLFDKKEKIFIIRFGNLSELLFKKKIIGNSIFFHWDLTKYDIEKLYIYGNVLNFMRIDNEVKIKKYFYFAENNNLYSDLFKSSNKLEYDRNYILNSKLKNVINAYEVDTNTTNPYPFELIIVKDKKKYILKNFFDKENSELKFI